MSRIGLIFDLDGVLVDTAKFHFTAWRAFARKLGIDFTAAQNEELKGVSRVESLRKILLWGDLEIEQADFDRLLLEKNDLYLELAGDMTENDVLEGVPEFLERAKQEGYGIALGSASRNAEMTLKKTHLLHYFESLIDGNKVTRSKPDPEVFLKGAAELGIEPWNCVVFEDSISGIRAAKAGGMRAIGIGKEENLWEADRVWKSMAGHLPSESME